MNANTASSEILDAAREVQDRARQIVFCFRPARKQHISAAKRHLADFTRHKDKLLSFALPPTGHDTQQSRAEWEYDFTAALNELHTICARMIEQATQSSEGIPDHPLKTEEDIARHNESMRTANDDLHELSIDYNRARDRFWHLSSAIDYLNGKWGPSTERDIAAAPAATGSTPRAGPEFTEADFERALAALDLILQDYAWSPGENKLRAETVIAALRARNITLALATALCRRLIDQKVFKFWSHTSPAGYSRERGSPLPVHRTEPEITVCFEVTRERWYGYLAKRRLEAPPSIPLAPALAGQVQTPKDGAALSACAPAQCPVTGGQASNRSVSTPEVDPISANPHNDVTANPRAQEPAPDSPTSRVAEVETLDKPKIGTVQSGQEAESPVQGLPAGQAEGQKTDAEVTKRRRPCYDRDHTWLAWYEDEETETYHRPAKIRDKWNCLSVEQRKAISPGAFNRIAEKRRGVDLVKKAIENALHERGSAK